MRFIVNFVSVILLVFLSGGLNDARRFLSEDELEQTTVYTSMEEAIKYLNKMHQVDLLTSDLTELPPIIGKLKNLRILGLHGSKHKSLPPKIAMLKQLRVIYLTENYLQILPNQTIIELIIS